MASGITQAAVGATFTSEDVRSNVIEPLRASAVVLAAATNVLYSSGDPLRLPKIKSTPVSDYWRSENTQIAEVNPDLGEVTLLPSTLKSFKVIHRISNELLRHAVTRGSIADVLGESFRKEISLALDKALLLGDGASNTIKGLAAQTGVQTVTGVGSLAGTAGIDQLHNAVLLALQANASEENLVWFMNPRELVTLRKSKAAGSGEYVFQPDPTVAARPTLFGREVFTTTQMPVNMGSSPANKSQIILADRTQFAVGIDQDFKVDLLPHTYADWDQTGIRLVGRFDVAALNPEAIVVLDGVQP